jgi:hypothetical protein
MANLCKFDKKQYQVSYDSGVTWVNVTPEQISKGDNMIEYDSPDCSSVDTMYRWRLLDGQYMCDGKEKWTKEIQEESYNNGLTWYTSYPTVYRKGTYVGIDETFCNDKFVGHYVVAKNTTSEICPKDYYWNGHKCVYHMKYDPLKIVKCNDSGVLTSEETRYYGEGYSLISCEIGDCVTSIGTNAFIYCSDLTTCTIGNGVTSIGENAFLNCTSLSSITIPNSVTSISNRAFFQCSGLTSIDIPSGVTTISDEVFYNCSSLTSCTIGNSVTSIGNYAFRYCGSLTSITIPSGVTNIGAYAFNGCGSLTSITIPSGVTSIHNHAFSECSSLTNITVNAITPPALDGGSSQFYITNNCPIYVPCNSIPLYKSAGGWSNYADRIQGIETSCTPTPTGATKFYSTYSNGDVFYKYCDSSTTLAEETQPSGYDHRTMISAEIGDCVTSIAYAAFYNCTSLTSITIPNSVTSIGNEVFHNCSSLTSVTCLPTTPPTLGTNAFYGTTCLIYVPAASVDAYKSASGWSDLASRIQPIT